MNYAKMTKAELIREIDRLYGIQDAHEDTILNLQDKLTKHNEQIPSRPFIIGTAIVFWAMFAYAVFFK